MEIAPNLYGSVCCTKSEIDLFNEYTQRNGFISPFMAGNEDLRRKTGYTFRGVYAKPFYQRGQLLQAVGIFNYFRTSLEEAQQMEDRHWEVCRECSKPERLGLDINLRVCFYILLNGIALAIIVALYETKAQLNHWAQRAVNYFK